MTWKDGEHSFIMKMMEDLRKDFLAHIRIVAPVFREIKQGKR
jgi:hypothetical protein